MSIAKLIAFLKDVTQKALVIILAVILVMLVASRNVEYELAQEAKQAQTQVEQGNRLP